MMLHIKQKHTIYLSWFTGSKLVFRISRLISEYYANPDAFERLDFRLEFLNNSGAVCSTDKIPTGKQTGSSQEGGWGEALAPQFFAEQLTLSQPGGADYAHHSTTCPPL